MNLSRAQRGAAVGIAAGLAATLAGFAAALWIDPLGDARDGLALRLRVLALCGLAPSLALAFAIGRVAAHRFRSPQDIDGSGLVAGTERVRLLQALVQNTLEQAALSLPLYAAWAILAPIRLVALLPAAALLFLLGRALFFRGYHRGAPGRALGFTLTFFPNAALLAGALMLALRHAGG